MIKTRAQPQTLIEVIRQHAAKKADEAALVYLIDGEDLEQSITFGELDRQARSFAAYLQGIAGVGERALILYPSGLDFITAYLGCLYAGVIAVPATVPHLKRSTPRLQLILKDAQARIACTTQDIFGKVQLVFDEYPEFRDIQWVTNEKIQPAMEQAWREPDIRPDHLAFLQYTSGSTSVPKGVMISHFNLLRTIQDIQIGLGYDESGIVSTWLPIFHDMGLIFGLLTPLCTGTRSYIMSPVSFMEKPFRWLNSISKSGATHTAAPNFAFDLCVRKITEQEKSLLDLHRLKVTANAAEPVRLETMKAFSEAFEPCRFNYGSFTPSYGLAEATVKVSNKTPGQMLSFCTLDPNAIEKNKLVFLPEGQPGGYISVGCGSTSIGADIRIVNPETRRPCPPDEIGEIWIQSDSVAQGYWGRPEASRETFQARLAESGEGPFLRTGDMGFIFHGGLHIAGRLKDMIIIQGRNFYPQDIELTVEKCHPALRPSCGAAFTVEDGDHQRLVVVQELKREYRKLENPIEVINKIRTAIAAQNGLRADTVVLIQPSTIPKTTSGKIQRRASKDQFLEGTLEVLFEWKASDLLGNPSGPH